MNPKKRYKIKLPSLLTIGYIIILGLFIGYLGPFGSYLSPLASRLTYWVIAVFFGYFIYFHTFSFFDWYFKDKDIHKALEKILPSFFSAVFLSLFIQIIINYQYGLIDNQFITFISLFPQVFIIGVIISIISFQFHKVMDDSKPSDKQTNKLTGKLFLDRLPENLGKELLCFVMEDHYLKVTTTKGEHMLLMRMKDAIKELEGYDGLQVHRSWWVARDAITSVKKENRNVILVLENNTNVPVSRSNTKRLKDQGYL